MAGYRWKQFQVVGRHLPTEKTPEPEVYRMKVWATDAVRARSKFWYFLSKLCRVKRSHGQVISCNEIFEKDPSTVKNFGIWVRYQSRTGFHNLYKEYRDTTLNGAVDQLYSDMASRHRVRAPGVQIIKTAQVPASNRHMDNVKKFVEEVSFPQTRVMSRPSSKVFKTTFKARRPNVAMY